MIRKFAFIINFFDLTFIMFFFSRSTKSIFESMTNILFFRFFRFLLRFFHRCLRLFFRRFFLLSLRSFSKRFFFFDFFDFFDFFRNFCFAKIY